MADMLLLLVHLVPILASIYTELDGIEAGDGTGWVSSYCGDVNKDGLGDVCIGAIYSQNSNGSGYVVFGNNAYQSQSVSYFNLSDLNGSNGFAILGQNFQNAGNSMSYADVNHDGFPDILLAASPGNNAGNSYVLFGKSTFSATYSTADFDGSIGFRVAGTGQESMGVAISGVGDINKDLFDDFLVGACGSSGSDTGRAYLIFGASTFPGVITPITDIVGPNGITYVDDTATGTRFGWDVRFGGDINQDTFQDLLVGAPYRGSQIGSAYVIFGSVSTSSPFPMTSLTGTNGFRIDGLTANAQFGFMVSGIYRFNNDAFDDFAVAAPSAGTGEVFIIFGRSTFPASFDVSALDGSNGVRITGAGVGDQFGIYISGGFDHNKDGYGDLFIGAPSADPYGIFDAGASYLIYGGPNPFPATVSITTLIDQKRAVLIGGVYVDGSTGFSGSPAGDFDGDGFEDLLITSLQASPYGKEQAGACYVIYGTNSTNLTITLDDNRCPQIPTSNITGFSAGDCSPPYAVGETCYLNCSAGWTVNGSLFATCVGANTYNIIGNCVDIDECGTVGLCPNPNTYCQNIPGSYNCPCVSGYYFNGSSCEDIDECDNVTSCPTFSSCSNSVGSFVCTCNTGYVMNNSICLDLNECLNATACPLHANCSNTAGSYDCTCNSGWQMNGTVCSDFNECDIPASCPSNSFCTNLAGSFNCTCNMGYLMNGTICSDINECSNATICPLNSQCTNNDGSFVCNCNMGFIANSSICSDIDECLNTTSCPLDSTCMNSFGNFSCQCNSGFAPNGSICSDINECLGSNQCDINADCTNSQGSYTCACKSGYLGSGMTGQCNLCLNVTQAVFSQSSASQFTLTLSSNATVLVVPTPVIGTTIGCNLIFNSTSLYYLTGNTNGNNYQQLTCTWTTTRTITVTGGTTASLIRPNQQYLDFHLASCAGVQYQVQLPSNPITPTANLVGPTQIGPCTSWVVLDASGTTGLAGRFGWFRWFLDGTLIANGSNLVTLNVSTPNAGIYNFSVNVTNVFGRVSPLVFIVVTKETFALPTVIISIPSSWDTSTQRVITPSIDLSAAYCNGTAPPVSTLRYMWTLNPAAVAVLDTTSSSLYLPAHGLLPGTYMVGVIVTLPSGVNASSSTSFTINLSSLRALIGGSVGGTLQAGNVTQIILSGTMSSDPDKNYVSNLAYDYQWSCIVLGTMTPCVGSLAPYTTNPSVLSFPPGVLGVGSYVISLDFTCISSLYPFPATRMSTAVLNLNVIPINVPQVSITGNPVLHNANDFLSLQSVVQYSNGTYVNRSSVIFTWNETNYGLNLRDPAIASYSTDQSSLQIVPFSLTPDLVYQFVLTVTDRAGFWITSASVLVPISIPPTPGTCSLTPYQGTEFDTAFLLFCEDWTTENYPLSYQFNYKGTGPTLTSLTSAQTSRLTSAYLPFGNWTIVVLVSDGLGSAAKFTIPQFIEVSKATVNGSVECYASHVIDTLINQTRALGNTNQLFQLVQSTISLLLQTTSVGTSSPECADQDTTIEVFRKQLWLTLLEALGEVTAQPYISVSTAEQLAQTLVQLVDSLSPDLNSSTNSSQNDLLISYTVNITRVVIQHVSARNDLGSSVIAVLSSLLETVPCNSFGVVTGLINLLSQTLLIGTVAGQDTATNNFISDTINGAATRLSSSSSITLTLGDLSFNFSQEMLSSGDFIDGEDFADWTLLRLGSAVRRCFVALDGSSPLGDIVTIDVTRNNTGVNVTGLNEVFKFLLPVDASAVNGTSRCIGGVTVIEQLTCHYWDPARRRWLTEGCETVGEPFITGKTNTSNGTWVLKCECVHLTDFSVLVKERFGNQCGEQQEKMVYEVFGYIYAFIALITGIQWCRIVYETHQKNKGKTEKKCPCQCSNLFLQHSLIFIVCVARCISSLRYAGRLPDMDLVLIGIISAFPYVFVFWIYTLLVFQWASLYHFSMSGRKFSNDPFRTVRPIFLVFNIIVALSVFIFFLAITTPTSFVSPNTVALVGSVTMATICLLAGVCFLVYARLISATLVQTGTGTRSSRNLIGEERPSRFTCFRPSIATKMLMTGIVVSFCFIGESVVWVLSVGALGDSANAADAADIYTALFLALDVMALIAILLIFRKAVNEQSDRSKSASKGSHHNTESRIDRSTKSRKYIGESSRSPSQTPRPLNRTQTGSEPETMSPILDPDSPEETRLDREYTSTSRLRDSTRDTAHTITQLERGENSPTGEDGYAELEMTQPSPSTA